MDLGDFIKYEFWIYCTRMYICICERTTGKRLYCVGGGNIYNFNNTFYGVGINVKLPQSNGIPIRVIVRDDRVVVMYAIQGKDKDLMVLTPENAIRIGEELISQAWTVYDHNVKRLVKRSVLSFPEGGNHEPYGKI